jgi:transcription antitermination protein NusB
MISRRLIRIKIVQVLYANVTGENLTIEKSDKEFQLSIRKAYDLYHYLILLLLQTVDYIGERNEIARNKILPTEADLNPNTRLIDNKVIQQLRNNEQFKSYVASYKLSFSDYPELVKRMHQKILDSAYYKEYVENPTCHYNDDKQFVLNVFANEFEDWDLLYQILEEQSIYWNDDIEFVVSMIIKTIEKFKETRSNPSLMELYKNEEDREFGKILLRKTLLKQKEYRSLVEKYTKNWELDRIAMMDILIIVIALTEITEFPSIPVKVTLNEYIEISKYYSTVKSKDFINGILDKVIIDMRKENKIIKTGRGLMGEAHE